MDDLDNYLQDLRNRVIGRSTHLNTVASSRTKYTSYWVDSHSNITKISDMTTNHIINIIKYLRRHIDGSIGDDMIYDNIDNLQKELDKRGVKEMSEKIQNVSIKVAGVTFKNEDGTSRGDKIREIASIEDKNSVKVKLVREPSNAYDTNAIIVFADDFQIGYVPKDLAMLLTPMIDNEMREFGAVVSECGEYKNRPYCAITVNEI